jgi:dipeptidase E
MSERRETRIKEFHIINTAPILGLREGTWIEVLGDVIVLKREVFCKMLSAK